MMNEQEPKGRFGLTAEEYDNLKTLLRMALAIFAAVAIALILVGTVANLLGGVA